MENLTLEFALWASDKIFDRRYYSNSFIERINISGRKVLYYILFDSKSELSDLELFSLFLKEKNIELKDSDKFSYFESKLEPVNFFNWLCLNSYFYFQWSLNGKPQNSYWSNYDKKLKKEKGFSSEELLNKFLKSKD